MTRLLHLCALGALIASSASAEVIYVDQLEPTEDGGQLRITSGDFEVMRREYTVAGRASFELLYLVADSTWSAAGADGVGGDHPPQGNLAMDDINLWRVQNNYPDRTLYIGIDVVPPPGSTSTTVVIKRCSMRVGDTLYKLDDRLVIASREGVVGEALLTLALGRSMSSLGSPHVASFRISGEIAAPPGTTVVWSMTTVPKGVIDNKTLSTYGGGSDEAGLRLAAGVFGIGPVVPGNLGYGSRGVGRGNRFGRVGPFNPSGDLPKDEPNYVMPPGFEDVLSSPLPAPLDPIEPEPPAPIPDDDPPIGPIPPIPEPGTLTLLAAGVLALTRRRRRCQ